MLYNCNYERGMFMPPKAKISKDMVTQAGLAVVRAEGAENLSVRRVAAELGCSTQPVMYHYRTVDELREDVYSEAERYHSEYIVTPDKEHDPMLAIGLRYILFAYEEKHLFRFMFESDRFHAGFSDVMYADGNNPMIKPLCEGAGLTPDQAAEAFAALFICVHGAASLLANNSIEYDEKYFERLLTNIFMGTIGMIKGEDQ